MEIFARYCRLGRTLAVLSWLASGCGSSQNGSTTPTANKITINVQSDKNTNQGRPLHLLVRAVDLKTYLEESYAAVANLVITPDNTVIGTAVVFPGYPETLVVDMPANSPIAVYFLFTEPGNPWKMRVDEPLPFQVDIALADQSIEEPE